MTPLLALGFLMGTQDLLTDPKELGFLMGFLMGTQDLLMDPKEFMDRFTVILTGKATRACTIRAAPRGHHGAWTLQAIPGHGLLRSA